MPRTLSILQTQKIPKLRKNRSRLGCFRKNKKTEKTANLGPKPRVKLYRQRTPDARMRQHISETKLRLDKFNKDSEKGKK